MGSNFVEPAQDSLLPVSVQVSVPISPREGVPTEQRGVQEDLALGDAQLGDGEAGGALVSDVSFCQAAGLHILVIITRTLEK
jgi:hypothetical protein